MVGKRHHIGISARACNQNDVGRGWFVDPTHLFSDLESELKIPLIFSLKPSALLKLADRRFLLFSLLAASSSSVGLTTFPPPPGHCQPYAYCSQNAHATYHAQCGILLRAVLFLERRHPAPLARFPGLCSRQCCPGLRDQWCSSCSSR